MDVPSTVMVLQVVGKAASGQLTGSQTQPLRAWKKKGEDSGDCRGDPAKAGPEDRGSGITPHFTAPLLCPPRHYREEVCVLMARCVHR